MNAFSETRYDHMQYRFCGSSGLKLPLISLGLWQNFGAEGNYETQKSIVHRAFDLGVTHFDLANNYGPPIGAAEQVFNKILNEGLGTHRAEMIISTKCGYRARPGPYGDGGSRKNILVSCDESLKRTGLDYFDIFYLHRQDLEIPVAETMAAFDHLVRQGKVLYIGVSSHEPQRFVAATQAIASRGLTPLTSFMSRYNLVQRQDEFEKWPIVAATGAGGVAFCPLAQGVLTSKYLGEKPVAGSRLVKEVEAGNDKVRLFQIERARELNKIAQARGQSLAQMSLAWVLRLPTIASALIGASSPQQVEENVGAIKQLDFSQEELSAIDAITLPSRRI